MSTNPDQLPKGKALNREEILEKLFYSVIEGILVVNERGAIIMSNPSCNKLFGYEEGELNGLSVDQLVPGHVRGRHTGLRKIYHNEPQFRKMGEGLDLYALRKDGSQFPVEISLNGISIEGQSLVIAFIIDITGRKKAENQSLQLGKVVDQTQNEIYLFDAASLKFVRVNRGAINNLGYTLQELLQMTPLNIVSHNYHPQLQQGLQQLQQGAQESLMVEGRHLRKDGSSYPVQMYLQLSTLEVNPVYIAIVLDISERKAAEEALRREKETAQMYLDIAAATFVLINEDETVQLINQHGAALLGKNEKEIVGTNWFDNYIPEENREEMRRVFHSIMDPNKEGIDYYENGILTANGETRLLAWSNTVIHEADGRPVATLSSGTDITDQRLADRLRYNAMLDGQEQERRRVAKELHDGLGQSLSAISLNLNILEPELEKLSDKSKSAFKNLKILLDNTVSDVKSISQDLMPRVLEDYGLVRALKYLCDMIGETNLITINLQFFGMEKRLQPKLEIALYRLAQELINNSLKHAQGNEISLQLIRYEASVVLMVEDNGQGFDVAAVRQTGGGLGLKNIENRVNAFGGEHFIDSSPEMGTSVTIEIPLQ